MIESIRTQLLDAARKQHVLTYTEVAIPHGLDMGNQDDVAKISQLLDEINVEEFNSDRPLLSAVVVRAENGKAGSLPGKGFFTMASRLGFDVSDNFMFFVSELKKVHDYWSKH